MDEPIAKKPTILVTGAAGLIGARLLKVLGPRFDTVGLDIALPRDKNDASDWIRCDLTDDESVADALSLLRRKHGHTLVSVIHLAAHCDFSNEPSPLYHDLNVEGTRRLLQGLKRFDVEQFILASSLLVMKPARPDSRLVENSPTQAEWDYPQSKLDAEAVVAEEHGRMPVLILRIAGVYDDDCRNVPIAQQIKRIYEKNLESYIFPGHPDRGQSFVHLEDLTDCIVRAVAHRNQLRPYKLLLVGEPGVVTYESLQDRIGQSLHARAWPTIRVPKAVAKVGAWIEEAILDKDDFIKPWMIDLADAHYPVDPSRAREKLGWVPHHSLRETLDIMLDRLKQNPRRWYALNGLPTAEIPEA